MCEFDVKNQPRGHSAGQGSDAGLVRIRLTALRAVHSEQASNLRPAAQEARSRRGGCPRGLQAVRGTGSRLFAALTCPRVCPLPGGPWRPTGAVTTGLRVVASSAARHRHLYQRKGRPLPAERTAIMPLKIMTSGYPGPSLRGNGSRPKRDHVACRDPERIPPGHKSWGQYIQGNLIRPELIEPASAERARPSAG